MAAGWSVMDALNKTARQQQKRNRKQDSGHGTLASGRFTVMTGIFIRCRELNSWHRKSWRSV